MMSKGLLRAIALAVVAGAIAVGMVAPWATAIDKAGSQNVALGRSYRLEPAPNYPWALGKRQTELTDGQTATGSFWTNGQSVGWSWHSPVIVTVDLTSVRSIEHVSVQTGANTTVGIRYPAQLLVFGGDGAGRFALLGESDPHREQDDPDKAETRFFDIRFPARKVKQIVVVAFARGDLLYLSEIEAYPAVAGAELAGTLGSMQEVRKAALRYRRAAIERLPDPRPVGPSMAQRWAMPLAAADGSSPATANDPAGRGCEAFPVSPWEAEQSSTVATPDKDPAAGDLVTILGGHGFAAWRIVNRTARDAEIRVAVEAPASLEVRMHALAYVQALNYAWVPDVVVPFEATTIPAQTAVIAMAEVHPRAVQQHRAVVTITCNGTQFASRLQVTALAADPTVPVLHGNLWSYLHEPEHAPVAKALQCAPDFHAHYAVDTVVVHPEALLDAGRGRPGNLLRQYLRAYKNARRVLLFMDIKSRPWAFLRLEGDKAAEALRDWWKWVQKVAHEEGVAGELLLYPVDEPGSADIDRLTRFRELVVKAGLLARIYATIDSKEFAAKLAWLDVIQILDPARNAPNGAGRTGLELYATAPDGRLLPVEGYYRAQGWTAFRLGLAGVGIWSSWDGTGIGDPATGWMPFGADDRDFALIYSGTDGCGLPSRRLLAWARGIEESQILRQCAARMPKGEVDRIVAATAKGGGKTMTQALAEVAAACRSIATGPPG
jgi:hypothetical protein